jgi:hypothetical protein
MNEECHLDAATAPGRENNAAPFPMAYAQCRLALSRRAPGTGPPEPGRRSSRAGVARCAKKMVNLFHTKFHYKVENGDGQSVPKFGGMLSQK